MFLLTNNFRYETLYLILLRLIFRFQNNNNNSNFIDTPECLGLRWFHLTIIRGLVSVISVVIMRFPDFTGQNIIDIALTMVKINFSLLWRKRYLYILI